jgi:hypothetical protein
MLISLANFFSHAFSSELFYGSYVPYYFSMPVSNQLLELRNLDAMAFKWRSLEWCIMHLLNPNA